MANWIDWNVERPQYSFYFKDENGVKNTSLAYIDNDKIMLAAQGDDVEYSGMISFWTYDGED